MSFVKYKVTDTACRLCHGSVKPVIIAIKAVLSSLKYKSLPEGGPGITGFLL